MIFLILLQIRFQLWQYQRFLTAKVRSLKRERLEQNQALLNTKLGDLILAHQQQQFQMEVILENFNERPPTTRTELLKVLNFIRRIRAKM